MDYVLNAGLFFGGQMIQPDNTYAWWDGAVQSQIRYKPNASQSTTYTTTYSYSGSGALTSVSVMRPSRRVPVECSDPATTPEPQATVGVSSHSRVGGVMPITSSSVSSSSVGTRWARNRSTRPSARRR